jgi:hypothetical protein
VFLIDVGVHQFESWSFAPDQLPANCTRGLKPPALQFIHNDNGNLEDCCNIQRSGTANNSRPIRLQNWEFDHRKYVSFVCHDSSCSEFARVQENSSGVFVCRSSSQSIVRHVWFRRRHVKVGASMCHAGIRISGARKSGPTVQESSCTMYDPARADMDS